MAVRLQLNFSLSGNTLPIETRRMFLSYFKHALSQYDADYEQTLYDGSAKMKNMTFAMYFPIAAIKAESVALRAPKMSVTLSTPDLGMGIMFHNALLKQEGQPYTYKSHEMTLLSQRLLNTPTIFTQRIRAKTLSPILVRTKTEDHRDIYLTNDAPEFLQRLNEIIEARIRILEPTLLNAYLSSGITIEASQLKKVVVKHYGQTIDGNKGTFEIASSPEILNFIYQSGLGSRCDFGFGCFERL
jgi:CRISPR-associated endoribonuclease Cas6